MRPLLDRREARAMDTAALERLGLPTIVLMENAGRGAAERIVARHARALADVVIVGGVGQNGGDAWVVARHLALAGVATSSFVVMPRGTGSRGDAAIMLRSARAMGLHVGELVDSVTPLRAALARATLVVDGLFGTGLTRPIEGVYADAVAAIAASRVPVVSLDLPSGVDADTGAVLGLALQAATTITFGAEKRGLHAGEGMRLAGNVDVVGIGAPLADAPAAEIVDDADLLVRLPSRALDAHKGTAGHVLVVGGSAGTTGAALLAAHGAFRAGAGLVTIATRPEARAAYDARALEVMTRSYESVDALLAMTEGKRAVVVGPGLGLDEASRALVGELVERCPVPLVLDADALTHLATIGLAHARRGRAPRVLTPHPGEATRMSGGTDVQRDRFASVATLVERTGSTVVLKGARTLVASPASPVLVCDRGGPMLGVGGSGDVLAGMVAALLDARSPDTLARSAAAAVGLHARAGERAAAADRGLLAHEIADSVPAVLAALRATPG